MRREEFFAVSSKMAVLEAEKGRAALKESAEYESLERRATALREDLDDDVSDFGEGEFERAFRDLDDADPAGDNDDLSDDSDFEDL